METGSEEKGRLENLPASADEYWANAKTQRIASEKSPGCKHNFVMVSSREAECRSCGAGFFLGPGWFVKKGHIYKDKDRVL